MLLVSSRHTLADLEYWAELEAADIVHGSRRRMTDLVERSIWAIRDFAAKGRFYVSLSWGKDSCVLAHLCMRAGIRGPYVHLKAVPTGNPENDRVRDAWLPILEPDAYDERIVDYCQIPQGLDFDAIEGAKDRLFYAAFREVERTWGPRHVSGIRADESHGRKMRMRRWGLASDNALAPLGWWTATDVFGYLAVHDLPVHPTYGMLGGGRWDRKHLRVDELGGERGTGMGRREWEDAYYGDVLRRLEAAKP